jgi:hypothetical protein
MIVSNGELRLKANRDYYEGEEIKYSHKAYTNDALMARFGEIQENNPFEHFSKLANNPTE